MASKISALPAVPSRSQAPAEFIASADQFLAALPEFRSSANNMADEIEAHAQATSENRAAVAADKAETDQFKATAETAAQAASADRDAVAADKAATAQFKVDAESAAQATAADRNAVADDKAATDQLKAAAETAAQAASADRDAVAADKAATAQFKVDAESAAQATAADRDAVAAGHLAVESIKSDITTTANAVADHAVQVTEDRAATGRDALQTSSDRQAVLDDKLAVGAALDTLSEMLTVGIPVDGLVQDETHRFVTDNQIADWDAKASTESPELTGEPKSTTPPTADQSTRISTTAFVHAVISAAITQLVGTAPATLDQISELATAIGSDPNFAITVSNQIAQKVTANAPISAGTAPVITWDTKGLVTGGRSLAVADLPVQVVLTNDARLSDARPASDVYPWAKAAAKPTYTYNEVGAPSVAGSGATGTWNINISGNSASAAVAGAVAWNNVTGRPTALSHFTNDSGFITGAGSCNYASSAGSVAWNAVSGRPTNLSNFTNDMSFRRTYLSTAGPSGGADGDVWIQYT